MQSGLRSIICPRTFEFKTLLETKRQEWKCIMLTKQMLQKIRKFTR